MWWAMRIEVRDVSGSVPIQVHGGRGTRTVNEKMEPEPTRFGTGSVYGTGPGLGGE